MPSVVLFIIYSSLFVYLVFQRPNLPDIFGWKMTTFLIITALLFGISYIATILTGPGYLPFYYPLQNTSPNGDVPDYFSGMVTNEEQLVYVKNMKLPKRTGYFSSTRRIVIRPDHFCGWTTSFIGKKNHKLFFLFNFWGITYISVFTVCSVIAAVNIGSKTSQIFAMIISIVYAMLGFVFGLLTGNFACSMLCEFSENVTTFEDMQRHRNKGNAEKVPTYDKGCCFNWEEIFGSRTKWYLWMLPIPAFNVLDDRYLIQDFSEADERTALL